MKPVGCGILSEFFKNSADVLFYVKIPTGKSAFWGLYYISQYLVFFNFFGRIFYVSEKAEGSSRIYNYNYKNSPNISDLIFTWLCPNNSEKDGHNSRRGSSRRSSSESSHSRRTSLTQRNGAILAATGKCISQVLFNKRQGLHSLRVHISRVYCSSDSSHSQRILFSNGV